MVWQIIRDERAEIKRIKDGIKDIDFWVYWQGDVARIYLHVGDDLRPKRSYYFVGEDAETFLRFVNELMNHSTKWELVEKVRESKLAIHKYRRGSDDGDVVIVNEFGRGGEDEYRVEVRTKNGYYRFRRCSKDMIKFIEDELGGGA